MAHNDPIPVIAGATGTGKTELALALARRLDAHVISADSRQIYKRLSAGTAKPAGTWKGPGNDPLSPDRFYDVEGVPHHLLDVVDPSERYSAGAFARDAGCLIDALRGRGKNVIVVGGTGLYLKALIDGLAPLPPADAVIRAELAERLRRDGPADLYAELARVDPDTAANTPPGHTSRVIRGLEVYKLTGKPVSAWHRDGNGPKRNVLWFGLRMDRNAHRLLIEQRCRSMVPGMIQETRECLKQGLGADAPALSSIGYRTAVEVCLGRLPENALPPVFIRDTCAYVKRQNTWFRAEKRIVWIDVAPGFDPGKIAEGLPRTAPP